MADSPEQISDPVAPRLPAAAADLAHALEALGLVAAPDVAALMASGPVYDLPGLLVARRLVTPQTLAALGLDQFERIGFTDDFLLIDPAAVALVDTALAARRRFLPIAHGSGRVHVAVAEYLDISRIGEIRSALPAGTAVVPELWPAAELRDAMEMAFDRRFALEAVLVEITGAEAQAAAELSRVAGGPRRAAPTRPAFELRRRPGPGSVVQDGPRRLWAEAGVRLINALLLSALEAGATSMTLEAHAGTASLRLRTGGAFGSPRTIAERHARTFTDAFALEAVSEAQGEVLSARLGASRIEVSLHRSGVEGVSALGLRRLGRPVGALSGLGLTDPVLRLARGVLARPRGLFVIASPLGHGRSESLAVFGRAAAGGRRQGAFIGSAAEFDLGDMLQVSASGDTAMAHAVRRLTASEIDLVLADDPPGAEAWAALLDAALAGAFVAASIRAPDAVSALARLRGFGLGADALALALRGLSAQALVPGLCPACRTPREARPAERQILGAADGEDVILFEATGCEVCGGTGRQGRVLVAEVLPVDGALSQIIGDGGTRADIQAAVRKKWGGLSLQAEGFARARRGDIALIDLLQTIDAGG